MLTYPQIDPVIFEIGPLAIRWYALAYIAGVLLGWWLLKRMNGWRDDTQAQPLLSPKALEDLPLYAIFGIILGGRLGYALFYNLPYFLEHPLEALMIWRGGMSFHGGLLGVILAMWLLARRFSISYFKLMDRIAVVAPIGLFFGRIANFINGELWGRVTRPDHPLAMVFPGAGPLPRHPSQLYQAVMEGLILFALLYLLARHTRLRERAGALSGVFLIGYGVARMTGEIFREPTVHFGVMFDYLTMGQWLSLPMVLLGLFLLMRSQRAS
jgi:phosphatidylglycerol:prolipoprotein diacylglycerol transferase